MVSKLRVIAGKASLAVWLLVGMAVALGSDLHAMAAPVPASAAASVSAVQAPRAPYGLAEGVVSGYFDAINEGDFSLAYSYLGAAWRGRQSYNSFVQGFASTSYDEYTVVDVVDGPEYSQVSVYLDAYQKDGSVKTFVGTYTLAYEGMYFKITAANIRQV